MLTFEGTSSSNAPYGMTLNDDYTALKQPPTAATKALQASIHKLAQAQSSATNPYNSGEWDGTVSMATVVALFNIVRYRANGLVSTIPLLGDVVNLLSKAASSISLVSGLLDKPWAADELVALLPSDMQSKVGDLVVLVWNNAGNIQKPLDLVLAASQDAPPTSNPGSTATHIFVNPIGVQFAQTAMATKDAISNRFYRYNTTRKIYVIYGPGTATGFGVIGESGCIYGDCQNLGGEVSPAVPAGFIKINEQALKPTGLPYQGEETDSTIWGKWWFWTLLAGGVAAVGAGGYYYFRKKPVTS